MDKSDEAGLINTVGGAAERAIASAGLVGSYDNYDPTRGIDEVGIIAPRGGDTRDYVAGIAFGQIGNAARARQADRAAANAAQNFNLAVGGHNASAARFNSAVDYTRGAFDRFGLHDIGGAINQASINMAAPDLARLGYEADVARIDAINQDITFDNIRRLQATIHDAHDTLAATFSLAGGPVGGAFTAALVYDDVVSGNFKATDVVGTLLLRGKGRISENAQKARLRDNLAASARARETSRFGTHADIERSVLIGKADNLNSLHGVSEFATYKIYVKGILHKIGKADAARITKSSGLPTRLHQQIRELRKVHGSRNVRPQVNNLGRTTTQNAVRVETDQLQNYYNNSGLIPIGNQSSFLPKI